VVLEGAEAKEKERVWVKNRTFGELDDNKLVDGVTGERNIYKKRGEDDPMFGKVQKLPKRMCFLMDVSSSMSRFNGSDRRLDRMCATTIMLMEALQGLEYKYDYTIVGHSGESEQVVFVPFGKPPTTVKERLFVIQRMMGHSSFCMSGDHTLEGTYRALELVKKEPADDYFMFLLSDANLVAYGVNPSVLAGALLSDPGVNSYAFFIAGEATAEQLKQKMPVGRAHTVLDTTQLPSLFRHIFMTSVLKA
jgi:hypothetical protein